MSKKSEFVKYVNELMSNVNIEMNEDARAYWEALSVGGTDNVDKPTFTENGKLVLNFMREHQNDMPSAKAKDIADGLLISSRAVSGAIRKLVTDGYVEKLGQDPVIYSLTEKGKSVENI